MKKFIITVLTGLLILGCAITELEEPRLVPKKPKGAGTTSTVPPVYYSEFGAKGDGITDDFDAIRRTHDAANIRGAKVIGDPGATYYIGATTKSAYIQTDVDWGDSNFIIDDTTVEKRGTAWVDTWLFMVESAQNPFLIHSVSGLKKGQSKLPLNLGQRLLLIAIDNTTRRYIRQGMNEDSGDFQKDVFIVDADGTVDPRAPIIWDFNNITSLTAYPIDDYRLTIKGGNFTTIANRGNDQDPYMRRGIRILRSNVLVDGIFHDVIGQEVMPVARYSGFITIYNCADVTVQNCTLTGRLPMNSIGTYEVQVNSSINPSFINCDQTNDHSNPKYWGVFLSNYSKNIIFDSVRWSRFDAHMGVYNTTILNSDLGHQGIQIIGSGTLRIENTVVRNCDRYIRFRPDYGASWEGNVYIKNGTFVLGSGPIISAPNSGRWNYGYQCYMPKEIYIDGFRVLNAGSSSVQLIVNSDLTTAEQAANQLYPYILTETVYIRGYQADNGLSYSFSNQYLRDNITIKTSWVD